MERAAPGRTGQIVTSGSLADMLNDQNRTGRFNPNSAGFGRNTIGSEAVVTRSQPVPESGQTLVLFGIAVGPTLGVHRRFARACQMS